MLVFRMLATSVRRGMCEGLLKNVQTLGSVQGNALVSKSDAAVLAMTVLSKLDDSTM